MSNYPHNKRTRLASLANWFPSHLGRRLGAHWRIKLRATLAVWLLLSVMAAVSEAQVAAPGTGSAVLKNEFIYQTAPYPQCHASTICEVDGTLVAAWFGGTRERALDVKIYLSRNNGDGWQEPVMVASGRDEQERIDYPCWNPVLFKPRSGPLLLFYKVGPSPATWWGLVKSSTDGGRTWSKARRLPGNMLGTILGPVRNKPVELADGTLLCGSSTEDAGWRVHMEWTRDFGKSWTRTKALNAPMDYGAIQPTILKWDDHKLQILCRTKQGRIVQSWSRDKGLTWSPMVPAGLPNPNTSVDATMLPDGRALLVYNHSLRSDQGGKGRGVLNVAVSPDGTNWQAAAVLEDTPGQEFSYPAVITSGDGLVHVTYTWKRERVKHVVLDPARFVTREIVEGNWPQ